MKLLEYIKSILVVTEFSLRVTANYLTYTLIQNLIAPLAMTILFYLTAVTTGGSISIGRTSIIFITMAIGSTIQLTTAMVSNDLVPATRDLLTSLAGDARVFIISEGIRNMLITILPQAIVISLITQGFDLVVYVLLAYLVTYSIATFVGTIVSEPMAAQIAGFLLYLFFSMLAPIYLTTTEWAWRIMPLSILNENFRDILQVAYTILLSSILLYFALCRKM
ncbi:MAG: hypothetical protein ACP5KW_10930 [Thermoproteota archaeon]|jgi:hypothetical protein